MKTTRKDNSATIYYYAAPGAAAEALAAALAEAMPDTVSWRSCEDAGELPERGATGIMALFDGAAPSAIPLTLACMYIAREGYDIPALQGGYQRVCRLPCRIGRLVDDCLACLRLSAYARLPGDIAIGRDRVLDWQGGIVRHPRFGPVALTDKERDILIALYEADENRLNRQALLDRVWAYAPDVETHTLETHIYRLRQKIEKDSGNPAMVLTDGDGYALNID